MRFYAVCTEAIQLTHRALQQLDQGRRGSRQPSRALRVATLYGHLQTRADASGAVRLALRDLAAAWNLQPRLLRDDISDLQALGWLSYRCDWRGTVIHLNRPLPLQSSEPAVVQSSDAAAEGTAPQRTPASEPATSGSDQALMVRFSEAYNQHKPQAWPMYSPRGTALAARLRRAIRHAGGPEAFWPLMAQALRAMPEFWRSTYPQGRSGADCAAALLSADRQAAGLGPDFWHVFSWGAAVGGASEPQEPDFQRACRLFAWGDHAWRGQGMEAFALPDSEKQRLTQLLEAAGIGERGQAARQFAPVTTP
jgi:hypothetical protein